jgi:DNA polymerase-1
MILEYRKLTKLRATYTEGLIRVADAEGMVHTEFKQTGTVTGRLSSAEPNLQNIPVRTPEGREMRRFFLPKSEGRVLVDADYSQIELRILAHLSGDEKMIEAFKSGSDIHRRTASEVFGIPEQDVTPELRKRAKAVNFGIIYGMGEYSLAMDLGITRAQAASYIESYFATYPKIESYLKGCIDYAAENGYTKTIFARRRHIPELQAGKTRLRAFGERVAMNSPIQGSAADIIKLAMINTEKALAKANIDAELALQVHDELIIDVAKADAQRAAEILKKEMEGAVSLLVDLTVDLNVGANWYECK